MSFLRSLLVSTPLIVLSTVVMGTLSLIASFFDRTGRSQHRIAQVWGRMLQDLRLRLLAGCHHVW